MQVGKHLFDSSLYLQLEVLFPDFLAAQSWTICPITWFNACIGLEGCAAVLES